MSTLALLDADLNPSSSPSRARASSKRRRWAGRALSALPVLFLALDSVLKLISPPFIVTASAKLGFSAGSTFAIGVVLATSLAVYLIPRTAILGAVLLTGYLGGAIATHVRAGDPLFSHVLAPFYVAILLWGGLYLRDGRLGAVFARTEWA